MLPGIGLFGTKNAKILVPILRENGFSVEAIWGSKLKEAEEEAADLQIPFYTNKIDDVLLRKNCDLIFIICSPNLHSQISIKALGIGKHVVCENPMSLSMSDALKMVRAAQYYPSLIALVSHSMRFLPATVKLRSLINEGYLGSGQKDSISLLDIRVSSPAMQEKYNWQCDKVMGGGVLNLIGSDMVDLISFVTQKRCVKVHGTVQTIIQQTDKVNGIRSISSDDFCCFQLELEGGTMAIVTLHSHLPFQESSIVICGMNGSYLSLRGGDLYGQSYSNKSEKEDVLYIEMGNESRGEISRPGIKGLSKMIGALREAFFNQEQSAGWIKAPVQNAATFEDGLYVQLVLDAVRKSSEDRSWVKVDTTAESLQQ